MMTNDQRNAYARAWREANRDSVNAQVRERYKADPDRYGSQVRRARLKHLGLSEEEYQRVLVAQQGVCAICLKPETVLTKFGAIRRLAVDHDHVTGSVRGLLCYRCNTTLGQYELNRVAIDGYLS